MTPELRNYAREVLLEAKLKVIKKAMEPKAPSKIEPFPSNKFHNWNEKMRQQNNYNEIVDFEFMRVISTDINPSPDSAYREAH